MTEESSESLFQDGEKFIAQSGNGISKMGKKKRKGGSNDLQSGIKDAAPELSRGRGDERATCLGCKIAESPQNLGNQDKSYFDEYF